MKKFFLICLLALASGLSITSCTDEVITPNDESGNTGGGGSDPFPKP